MGAARPGRGGADRFHDFDIVGTQEGFRHQVDDLAGRLPGHACSSHGRDNGGEKGEQVAIFYKKDGYELLDEGCFWPSATPDRPSVGWDASLPRICGWAEFRPKAGGEPFFFFSVHFDHRGEQARRESARLVLSKIDVIAGRSRVFLVGDFNADQDSENAPPARGLATAGRRLWPGGVPLRAQRHVQPLRPGVEDRPAHRPRVRAGGKHGEAARILTDTYRVPKPGGPAAQGPAASAGEGEPPGFEAKMPSDHFPVLVGAWATAGIRLPPVKW